MRYIYQSLLILVTLGCFDRYSFDSPRVRTAFTPATHRLPKGAVITALWLSRDKSGMATPQERATLKGLLIEHEPRDEVLHGLEYAAITEIVERSSIFYLKRWTRSSLAEAN